MLVCQVEALDRHSRWKKESLPKAEVGRSALGTVCVHIVSKRCRSRNAVIETLEGLCVAHDGIIAGANSSHSLDNLGRARSMHVLQHTIFSTECKLDSGNVRRLTGL